MSTPKIPIVRALPRSRHSPGGGEDELDAMVGATIADIGSYAEPAGIEGGGLVVDYVPAGGVGLRRVVFAFTELGMWVEEGPHPMDDPSK